MTRQPPSSESDSSGYFTPPNDQHKQATSFHQSSPKLDEEAPTKSVQSERFVQATPTSSHSSRLSLRLTDDDSDGDDEISKSTSSKSDVHLQAEDTGYEADVSKDVADEAFTIRRLTTDSFTTVREERITGDVFEIEETMEKAPSLNSLEDFDLIANRTFGDRRVFSQFDLNKTPEETRKTVNSAPTLNDVTFSAFKTKSEDPPSTKSSLPGSVIDFQEIELIREVVETNPSKNNCKTTITRQMSRRRMYRLPKSETDVFPETLKPFPKPKEGLNETLAQLENADWEVVMRGLEGLVKLIRHHRTTIETNIHAVCVALGKQVKNLRSQVARAACLAVGEMLRTFKKSLEAVSAILLYYYATLTHYGVFCRSLKNTHYNKTMHLYKKLFVYYITFVLGPMNTHTTNHVCKKL